MQPPLPKSNTTSPGFSAAIALGLPQPSPKSEPSGNWDNSDAEYPRRLDGADSTAGGPPQHPPAGAQLQLLPCAAWA
jgi:hypothetical protein